MNEDKVGNRHAGMTDWWRSAGIYVMACSAEDNQIAPVTVYPVGP
jgi:hypothetical protein